MRVASTIELNDTNRKALKKVADSNTLSVRFARRARIVLLASQGMTNQEIAQTLGIGRLQVALWRERFLEGGITELRQDRPRGGRKVRVDTEEIVRLTTQSCPVNATHWSTRSMAAMANTSPATVRRIWRAHGLKPHRICNVQGLT